ncbi:MAG TPA: hypothetical protein VIH48_00305 [Candidatus Bathyarchaeia archaeon]
MVATVNVQQITGASGSKTYNNIATSTRLQTKDQFAPTDTSFPIPIPSSSFKYSYWASICLDLAGTFTKINNVKFWSDGAIGWSFGTGGELRRGKHDSGDQGCPDASYEQAAGTEGDTGYTIEDATNGHDYYKGQSTPTQNVANDTSGAKAQVDTTDYTSAGKTKHLVLQVKVASDATQILSPCD